MLRLYVLMLAETGARSISEVLRLRWEDVDLEGGFLWIPSRKGQHRTKSGKGRYCPLTPRLLSALRDHFAEFRMASYKERRPEYLFHHTRNRPKAKAGERVQSFRRALVRAIERAELPAGFVAHDLRHRRITTWLAEGKSATLVREAVGHADLATTMHYTHLAKEHLRALVDSPEPSPGAKKREA